jgi:hypothetical protein
MLRHVVILVADAERYGLQGLIIYYVVILQPHMQPLQKERFDPVQHRRQGWYACKVHQQKKNKAASTLCYSRV